MINRKAALPALLALAWLSALPGCKKSPTETSPDTPTPTVALVLNPTTGSKDQVVSASIPIKGNSQEMRVFGLDVTFDSRMFEFQEVRKGTLTGGWAEVAGNEVSPGSLKVGGFVGGGTAIPARSEGTLAELLFKVTGSEYGNGQQSQVCVLHYTDDLSAFTPASACASFTLKK
jgi:hypothetical protein